MSHPQKLNIGLGYMLWIEGVSTTVMAERLGVCPKTIWKASRKHGWPKRRLVRNLGQRVIAIIEERRVVKRCPRCGGKKATTVGGSPVCCSRRGSISIYVDVAA